MEEYREWFEKAEEDFDTALYNLKGKRMNAGIFFLQQSAEKALKAIYIKKFKELIRTHDLVIIANRINAPDFILGHCKKLSPVYLYTRYPDVSYTEDLTVLSREFV